jgi:hypothetical protein
VMHQNRLLTCSPTGAGMDSGPVSLCGRPALSWCFTWSGLLDLNPRPLRPELYAIRFGSVLCEVSRLLQGAPGLVRCGRLRYFVAVRPDVDVGAMVDAARPLVWKFWGASSGGVRLPP